MEIQSIELPCAEKPEAFWKAAVCASVMLMARVSRTRCRGDNCRLIQWGRGVEREKGRDNPVHRGGYAGCHELDGDSQSDIVWTSLAYWLYLRDSRCAQ